MCSAARIEGGHEEAIRRRGDIFTASKGKTQESVITGICNQMRTRRAANNRRSHNVVSSRSLLVPQTFRLSLLPLSFFSLFLALISPFVSAAWVSPRKTRQHLPLRQINPGHKSHAAEMGRIFLFPQKKARAGKLLFFLSEAIPFDWPQKQHTRLIYEAVTASHLPFLPVALHHRPSRGKGLPSEKSQLIARPAIHLVAASY